MKIKSLPASLLPRAQDGEHAEPFTKGRNFPLLGILSLSLGSSVGLGEIFRTICLLSYGHLSNYNT